MSHVRIKWSFESSGIAAGENKASTPEKHEIEELLSRDCLTVHYQPIFSSKDGSVFGYEALARIKDMEESGSVEIRQLFSKATEYGLISQLDVRCRENALRKAAQLSLMATEVKKAAKMQCGSSIVRDKRLNG
ncbi:MAG: EAL domain-containing protein [Nitrospirae bacterium]|nr:EAL domain-containing protein [Nitrospirota bacterium]